MRLAAFDIDGVVADTYDVIEKALYNAFGIHFPKEEHTSFHFNVPNVDPMEVVKVIDECMLNDFNSVEPLGNAVYALRRIHMMTRRPLLFVTARPKACKIGTYSWLRDHLSPNVKFDVILTENKPKTQVLLDNDIEVFVDDRYKTIIEISSVIDRPLLFNSTWNEGRPIPKNVIRINDLEEVIHYL